MDGSLSPMCGDTIGRTVTTETESCGKQTRPGEDTEAHRFIQSPNSNCQNEIGNSNTDNFAMNSDTETGCKQNEDNQTDQPINSFLCERFRVLDEQHQRNQAYIRMVNESSPSKSTFMTGVCSRFQTGPNSEINCRTMPSTSRPNYVHTLGKQSNDTAEIVSGIGKDDGSGNFQNHKTDITRKTVRTLSGKCEETCSVIMNKIGLGPKKMTMLRKSCPRQRIIKTKRLFKKTRRKLTRRKISRVCFKQTHKQSDDSEWESVTSDVEMSESDHVHSHQGQDKTHCHSHADHESDVSDEELQIDADNNFEEIDGQQIPRHSQLEKTIGDVCVKNKLSTSNAKSIIRSVVTNPLVKDMLISTLQQPTEDPPDGHVVYEPKLTRSRIREVMEKEKNPQLWPVSPIKLGQSSTSGPSILDVEFPEDEDDEYEPSKDLENAESDEESCTSTVTSEVGSPFPVGASPFQRPPTPVTPGVSVSTPVTVTPTHAGGSAADPTGRTGSEIVYSPMGPPLTLPRPTIHSTKKRLTFLPAIENLQTKDAEDGIARRTRSKLPLTTTSIHDIEEAFVAPDITADMYDTNCDDTEWQEFLKSLQKYEGAEIHNESMEVTEEDDPEFNYIAEVEEEENEPEEDFFQGPFRVSRKELNGLMEELDELFNDDFSVGGMGTNPPPDEENISKKPTSKTVSKKKTKSNLQSRNCRWERLQERGGQPEPRETSDEVPAMTECQIRQLQQQMREHIQLTTQMYVLTQGCNESYPLATGCKQMVRELNMLGNLSMAGQYSLFNACNLTAAVELINRDIDWASHRQEYLTRTTDTQSAVPESGSDQNPVLQSTSHQTMAQQCNGREEGIQASASGNGHQPPKCRPDRSRLSENRKNLLKIQKEVMWRSPVFMYPSFLPKSRLLASASAMLYTFKRVFSQWEDRLLILGVDQFKKWEKEDCFQLIHKYMMPCRSPSQLKLRFSNAAKQTKSGKNIIWDYKMKNELPVTPREAEHFSLDMMKAPCEQPFSVLPPWCKGCSRSDRSAQRRQQMAQKLRERIAQTVNKPVQGPKRQSRSRKRKHEKSCGTAVQTQTESDVREPVSQVEEHADSETLNRNTLLGGFPVGPSSAPVIILPPSSTLNNEPAAIATSVGMYVPIQYADSSKVNPLLENLQPGSGLPAEQLVSAGMTSPALSGSHESLQCVQSSPQGQTAPLPLSRAFDNCAGGSQFDHQAAHGSQQFFESVVQSDNMAPAAFGVDNAGPLSEETRQYVFRSPPPSPQVMAQRKNQCVSEDTLPIPHTCDTVHQCHQLGQVDHVKNTADKSFSASVEGSDTSLEMTGNPIHTHVTTGVCSEQRVNSGGQLEYTLNNSFTSSSDQQQNADRNMRGAGRENHNCQGMAAQDSQSHTSSAPSYTDGSDTRTGQCSNSDGCVRRNQHVTDNAMVSVWSQSPSSSGGHSQPRTVPVCESCASNSDRLVPRSSVVPAQAQNSVQLTQDNPRIVINILNTGGNSSVRNSQPDMQNDASLGSGGRMTLTCGSAMIPLPSPADLASNNQTVNITLNVVYSPDGVKVKLSSSETQPEIVSSLALQGARGDSNGHVETGHDHSDQALDSQPAVSDKSVSSTSDIQEMSPLPVSANQTCSTGHLSECQSSTVMRNSPSESQELAQPSKGSSSAQTGDHRYSEETLTAQHYQSDLHSQMSSTARTSNLAHPVVDKEHSHHSAPLSSDAKEFCSVQPSLATESQSACSVVQNWNDMKSITACSNHESNFSDTRLATCSDSAGHVVTAYSAAGISSLVAHTNTVDTCSTSRNPVGSMDETFRIPDNPCRSMVKTCSTLGNPPSDCSVARNITWSGMSSVFSSAEIISVTVSADEDSCDSVSSETGMVVKRNACESDQNKDEDVCVTKQNAMTEVREDTASSVSAQSLSPCDGSTIPTTAGTKDDPVLSSVHHLTVDRFCQGRHVPVSAPVQVAGRPTSLESASLGSASGGHCTMVPVSVTEETMFRTNSNKLAVVGDSLPSLPNMSEVPDGVAELQTVSSVQEEQRRARPHARKGPGGDEYTDSDSVLPTIRSPSKHMQQVSFAGLLGKAQATTPVSENSRSTGSQLLSSYEPVRDCLGSQSTTVPAPLMSDDTINALFDQIRGPGMHENSVSFGFLGNSNMSSDIVSKALKAADIKPDDGERSDTHTSKGSGGESCAVDRDSSDNTVHQSHSETNGVMWTRARDRVILEMVRDHGDSADTYSQIAATLSGVSVQQVSERVSTLLELMDSSEDETEDATDKED